MKSLESWLKTRRKVQAITMVGEHSKDTVMAIEQLQRCISFAIEGRREDLERCFNVLSQKEKEADVLKKKIIIELAKGDLPPNEREDLMRLARSIDQVIDWINETGRILVEFDLDKMPEEIKAIVRDMMRVIRDCVVKLDFCTGKLIGREFDDALTAADAVERLEEEMDGLYQKARGAINGLRGDDVAVGPTILLSQFMDAMENITDRCEDTIDEIRTISVATLF
jgi:predicted phosphate transport protein (TIGR00153 family)